MLSDGRKEFHLQTDMRISSMRFLVWVFKQESKEILSICPCSIRCRMMFLPEAPKISETKEDRRKSELCKNFFNPVFLRCNITDDTFAVAVQVTELPNSFFRDKASIQQSGTKQSRNPLRVPHICLCREHSSCGGHLQQAG